MRVDGRLNLLALQHASGKRSHLNFVLGLLVFLDFEIPAHPAFAISHLKKVVAERGVRGKRQVIANGAIGRNGEALLVDRFLVRILDLDLDSLTGRNLVAAAGLQTEVP